MRQTKNPNLTLLPKKTPYYHSIDVLVAEHEGQDSAGSRRWKLNDIPSIRHLIRSVLLILEIGDSLPRKIFFYILF